MPKFLQFKADLLKVVNLAVEDQPAPCSGIVHGLVAGRGQVEDSEPPRAQPDALLRVRAKWKDLYAFVVRAAVGQSPRSLGERLFKLGRAFADYSKDSAHALTLFVVLSSLSLLRMENFFSGQKDFPLEGPLSWGPVEIEIWDLSCIRRPRCIPVGVLHH